MERGIAWQGEPAADRFVLDMVVDNYEPGNAFKRWLLPGYGATILHVSGSLTDASSGEVAGEIDHERGVYAGGGYTIGAWKTVFGIVADDIAHELENRIENKGFVVRLAPWPSRDVDIPPAARPQTFSIARVTDARPERGRIGERTAAFGVGMGDVFFDRSVPEFIEEAVSAELLGAGHRLASDGSGRPVAIEVVGFWTHTDTTALYWDVKASIELAIAVGPEAAAREASRSVFRCEAVKRTYVWPSLALVSEVMDQCLVSLMRDIRSDSIWAGTAAPVVSRSTPNARLASFPQP